MEDIATLASFWIFDKNGNIKQVKQEADRPKAKEIYTRAREALRFSRIHTAESPLQRIAFVNQAKEWTITLSEEGELIVMHKDSTLTG